MNIYIFRIYITEITLFFVTVNICGRISRYQLSFWTQSEAGKRMKISSGK